MVDSELVELGVDVGFVGNTILGVSLPPEQKRQYQAIAGELSYKALSDLFASKPYGQASQTEKVKMVNKAIERVRDTARDQIKPGINLKDVDPIIKERVEADQLLLRSSYFSAYKLIPRFKEDPALQSQYEEYLDAKGTDTLPQWVEAGGDLKEMERWDRVAKLVKKEMVEKNPDLDKALVSFYGTSPKTAEGRRLLAQTKPLEALTDISARGAARLNAAGIYSLDDFLAADPNTLLQTLGASQKAIRNMRREARQIEEGK